MAINRNNYLWSDDYVDTLSEIMKGNREFLDLEANDTHFEVVELINDAIDRITEIAASQTPKEFSGQAMSMFAFQFLFPRSSAIYVDLLAGNLSACFVELRSILEALARCYFADQRFQDQPFFMNRLSSLEPNVKSVSKLMRELGEELQIGREVEGLWRTLSRDWVHTTGIAVKVVDQISNASEVPIWALVIPGNYTASDLETLIELRMVVSKFRSILPLIS